MRLVLGFFFLLIGITSCNAQTINGVYADSSDGALKNCYAIFSQEEDTIRMTHYLEFEGASFVEHGQGIVKGDSLIYAVTVTLNGPDWPTQGVHRLRIEQGGEVLRGIYRDSKGNSGPLVFLKRKFD